VAVPNHKVYDDEGAIRLEQTLFHSSCYLIQREQLEKINFPVQWLQSGRSYPGWHLQVIYVLEFGLKYATFGSIPPFCQISVGVRNVIDVSCCSLRICDNNLLIEIRNASYWFDILPHKVFW